MTTKPSVHDETPQRAAARAILLGIAGRPDADVADRLAAVEALGALEDHLPADLVWAPVQEQPGSLDEARRLLQEAAEDTPAGRTAVSLAIGYLRRRADLG